MNNDYTLSPEQLDELQHEIQSVRSLFETNFGDLTTTTSVNIYGDHRPQVEVFHTDDVIENAVEMDRVVRKRAMNIEGGYWVGTTTRMTETDATIQQDGEFIRLE